LTISASRLLAGTPGADRAIGYLCKYLTKSIAGTHGDDYNGPDGLKRPAPHTFATETDANVWLTVTEAEIVRGNWIDPDAGRIPVGEYAARWIAERPGLAPRTTALYKDLLRLHIEPMLGPADVVDLTPARVRSWRTDLLESGVVRRRSPSATGSCVLC
jgi:Phage integrase, N-terminal SAM-like domain